MVDYYKILEVPRNSSSGDIKKAYRRLALIWHPDKNLDKLEIAERKFKEISQAYEVLSDDRKKQVYDAQRGRSPGRPRTESNRQSTRASTQFPFNDLNGFFSFNQRPYDHRFFDSDRSSGSSGSSSDDEFEQNGRRFSGGSAFDQPFFVYSSFDDDDSIGTYNGNGRRTCSSTRFVNGQQIETRTVVDNGVKTITISVFENGQLVSKTVNGEQQAL